MATRRQTSTQAKPEPTRESDTPPLSARTKALVFISHDSRDADLAEALANLLSDVSAGTLKSFRSSDKKGTSGIEFGAEWYTAIMSQIGDATDVVALLTPRSIERPWILYEAGVAKGKLETTVLGLALGVPLEKVSTGPFGQFQNCGDDEDSLTKLVMQLLQRNPDAAPREEAVRMKVRLFVEAVAKIPAAKPKKDGAGGGDEQSVAKLFEEVKAMVRELPERVDDRVRTASKRGPARRLRRFHPMMIEELLSRSSLRDGPGGQAAALLLVLAFLKDDVPWIYEPGVELYRALLREDQHAITKARQHFHFMLETTMHGPWFHEMLRPDDEETYFLVRHLPTMLEPFLGDLGSPRGSRKGGSARSLESTGKSGT